MAIVVFLPVFNSCAKKSYANLSYDMTIEYSEENNLINAVEKVTFVNKTQTSYKELYFNLYPKAYRKDSLYKPVSSDYERLFFYNGESYGDIVVSSVRQKGKNAEYHLTGKDENILAVKLNDELYYGDKVTLEISFTVNLPKVVHRLGKNGKTINIGNFYPSLCVKEKSGDVECEYYAVGDPFYAYSANYTVKFVCPEKYVCAFSGKTVSETRNGGKRYYAVRINGIRDFMIVLSENYKVKSAEKDGVEIKYYYFSDENPNAKTEIIEKGLKFFGELFGKYPYKTYTVAETPFISGGMEYGASAMVKDGEDDYKKILLHELAHQWWYGAVGNNQLDSSYIDEGLAEYSVLLYSEFNEDKNKRKEFVSLCEKSYKTFCSVYDALKLGKDTRMNRSLAEYKTEYEYYELNYVLPVIMYDMARESVGDKLFFKGLKNLYSDNKFKICDFESLCGAFEKAGADLSGFFESFVYGKAII